MAGVLTRQQVRARILEELAGGREELTAFELWKRVGTMATTEWTVRVALRELVSARKVFTRRARASRSWLDRNGRVVTIPSIEVTYYFAPVGGRVIAGEG